ncbi:MAG: COR domain-containing protein [Cyanobacteria bacterium J06634_6]
MTQDELLRLIDQAAAENWTTLDLAGKGLSELPPEIGKLTNLKTLVLGRWDKKKGPFGEAIGNDLSVLPDEIGRLTELRSLFLAYNKFEEMPEVVGELRKLRSLNLRDNQLSTLPEVIGQFSSLQSLDLSSNQLSTLPEVIGQLSNLQSLDLSSNQLSTLPEVIGQLSSLQSLDLSSNQLSTLPESFGQLSSLQSINLCNNQLTEFPLSLCGLSNLLSLTLGGNFLRQLPSELDRLVCLKKLSLGSAILIGNTYYHNALRFSNASSKLGNQLVHVPNCLFSLPNLEVLDLSFNQLSDLDSNIQHIKSLKQIDIRGNPLPIPPEILGKKRFTSEPGELSKIFDFYFQLQAEEGSTPLYEAKLILVGEGGAGKTSLAKKIDNEAYELPKDEKSTEGIDVIRWDFSLPDGNTFRVNIWDFGGQEIYHATHQFFLTKRSLYLLVADTRQENTDFYYWLKIVELLSDSSPVLVIKNEKQDRQCEIDEGLFKSQFNNLKDSFPTNLKDGRGLTDIKDAIRYHISKLPHVGNPLPRIWVRVRAALGNYAQNCNTITVEKYCDICRQNGFTDKQQMLFLSSYLHDLGVCLHFQDDKLLKRTVILKPEWATTAVYKVADSDTVRNNKGRFTEADTAEIWSDSQYSDLRDELLQLMMRFKLAYELPNTPGNYIAPQLLPISKPNYAWDNTNNLVLRYHYDFMPKGILTRFIVETNSLIENQDHVWKNGVILAEKWSRAQIVENYPKSEITIHISGTNKKPLLEIIRHEFWKIHQSYERLDYKELIPCNCPECKNSNEPEFYPYDLLMKYIAKRRYNIECRTSIEPVDVRRLISDITDQPQYENNTQYPSVQYGDVYHQYGPGDNVAGKKVGGNNIDIQNGNL